MLTISMTTVAKGLNKLISLARTYAIRASVYFICAYAIRTYVRPRESQVLLSLYPSSPWTITGSKLAG